MKAQSELAGDCKSVAEMTAPHALHEATERDSLIEKIGKLTDTGSMFDITVAPISESVKKFGDTLSTLSKPMEVVLSASHSGNAVKTTSQIRRKSSVLGFHPNQNA